MFVREAVDTDLDQILAVEEEAFGKDEGPEIAELIKALLSDPTAIPLLSVVAEEGGRVIGHILFSSAVLETPEERAKARVSLLAPLAVASHLQRRGIGGRLINAGLEILAARGVGLVFVLGHPEYYPRHGFQPAIPLGFSPPYPIPEEVADAWMVQELKTGIIGNTKGKVLCAAALDRPEYWRE